MNTLEFTELVATLLPRLSENTQTKAARQLMHILTLIYCFDNVKLSDVRYASGKQFMDHIVRNKPLVNDLARAVGIVVPMAHPGSTEAPSELLDLAKKHHICIKALQTPRKKPYDVHYELHTLVTFMQVVHKLLGRLEPADLQMLERGYYGHCHPSYAKPKRTFRSLFGQSDPQSHMIGLAASQLPGARARTEVVPESGKFPIHPRLRTVSQSSGATHTSKSTLPQYRPRASSNASLPPYRSMSRQPSTASFRGGQPVLMTYAVPVAVPVPVYTCQNITYENGQRQVVEQVYMPAVQSHHMKRN